MNARDRGLLAIGGIAMDRTARIVAGTQAGASNPGRIEAMPGGVARNVAETTARLGVPVAMAAMVGADSDGDALLRELTALGIDTGRIERNGETRTAGYIGVFGPGGDLVVGVADMDAAERFDAQSVTAALAAFPGYRVLVDANLAPAALSAAVSGGRRIAAAAVSPVKALRLVPHLSALDTLFLNRREAAALVPRARSIGEAAHALRARGIAQGVLTAGEEGLVFWSDGTTGSRPAPAGPVLNVNGAGDTLIGAVLAALCSGRDFGCAVDIGIMAAALTLRSARPVSPDIAPSLLSAPAGLG